MASDLEQHKTIENWAKEGAVLARKVVCLDGELLKARDDGQGVLEAPGGYAQACGQVARMQIGMGIMATAPAYADIYDGSFVREGR